MQGTEKRRTFASSKLEISTKDESDLQYTVETHGRASKKSIKTKFYNNYGRTDFRQYQVADAKGDIGLLHDVVP